MRPVASYITTANYYYYIRQKMVRRLPLMGAIEQYVKCEVRATNPGNYGAKCFIGIL